MNQCYECKYRRPAPGSTHSKCEHPATKGGDNKRAELLAILASVGRGGPAIGPGAEELAITADAHGLASGWFNWPFNFDPTWLGNCDGFTAKETQHENATGRA